ncbi:hypothetical protein [Spiroplasma endosymbiont of Aspidapion aeneum]|uniref:hypothetical protein n=1 Tax=Spiroplasma endosymbiont of Aspidapion aeneum TaxID=3066276 RepID=UPI00313D7124
MKNIIIKSDFVLIYMYKLNSNLKTKFSIISLSFLVFFCITFNIVLEIIINQSAGGYKKSNLIFLLQTLFSIVEYILTIVFIIYLVGSLFGTDFKDKQTSIELRHGISYKTIYLTRIAVLFTFILFFVFIYSLFGVFFWAISPYKMTAITSRVFLTPLLFILVIDLIGLFISLTMHSFLKVGLANSLSTIITLIILFVSFMATLMSGFVPDYFSATGEGIYLYSVLDNTQSASDKQKPGNKLSDYFNGDWNIDNKYFKDNSIAYNIYFNYYTKNLDKDQLHGSTDYTISDDSKTDYYNFLLESNDKLIKSVGEYLKFITLFNRDDNNIWNINEGFIKSHVKVDQLKFIFYNVIENSYAIFTNQKNLDYPSNMFWDSGAKVSNDINNAFIWNPFYQICQMYAGCNLIEPKLDTFLNNNATIGPNCPVFSVAWSARNFSVSNSTGETNTDNRNVRVKFMTIKSKSYLRIVCSIFYILLFTGLSFAYYKRNKKRIIS